MLYREFYRGHAVSSGRPGEHGAKDVVQRRGRGIAAAIGSVLCTAFLPEGYPESVTSDYIGFQGWDTAQALSSYVRGMLTSQAIMRGVGVGEQAATPLAAVFTFFLRDMAGMLGGIVFAYLEGSSFDSCAKQWRLFADIINDIGMTVELASPLLPRAMFLPIACFGSIARSVTGVAGGATRAALTQHFALRGNAADVSAKEQSQETATTILGMVVGMAVTRLTSHHLALSWAVFAALTAWHVAANVAAMRCLLLASLNRPRLDLVVGRYLSCGQVVTPLEASQLEDLMPPPFRRILDWARGTGTHRRQWAVLSYGSSLRAVLRAAAAAQGTDTQAAAKQLLAKYGSQRYMVAAVPAAVPAAGRPGPPRGSAEQRTADGTSSRTSTASTAAEAGPCVVHVVLHRHAAAADCLRAFVHAQCLLRELNGAAPAAGPGQQPSEGTSGKQQPHSSSRSDGAAGSGGVGLREAEAEADKWMAARFGGMVSELRAAGWHVERVTLPRPVWSAEWEGPAPHQD